ncbi:MAG: DUF4156 domain-containing protein [Bdellovibrionales bacterium]
MKHAVLAFFCLTLGACASRSVLPEVKEVKVSRDEPSGKCKEIGKLTGTASSAKGTQQESLDDLKREAANKGANYVVVKQYSDYGTAVTGIAYECP